MHWAIIYGGQATEVLLFLPKIIIMYFLLLVGVVFYISKFPEKSFPGEFFFDVVVVVLMERGKFLFLFCCVRDKEIFRNIYLLTYLFYLFTYLLNYFCRNGGYFWI